MNTYKQNQITPSDKPQENLYKDEYFRGIHNHISQCSRENCAVIKDAQMMMDKGVIGSYYMTRMNIVSGYSCVCDVWVIYQNAYNYSQSQ